MCEYPKQRKITVIVPLDYTRSIGKELGLEQEALQRFQTANVYSIFLDVSEHGLVAVDHAEAVSEGENQNKPDENQLYLFNEEWINENNRTN